MDGWMFWTALDVSSVGLLFEAHIGLLLQARSAKVEQVLSELQQPRGFGSFENYHYYVSINETVHFRG